jgi:hypothetical protein
MFGGPLQNNPTKIWGALHTYGQFKKKYWQRCKFYTFPILFKKEIVFDS